MLIRTKCNTAIEDVNQEILVQGVSWVVGPHRNKASIILIPYRRSSTRGPSFASDAPAPTRLIASDELGLDCELMPYSSFMWQPANTNALP